MDYTLAYTYFAKKPKTGFTTLLFGALCVLISGLIPFVSIIVWTGHRAEVSGGLDDDPNMRYHRDFDANRIVPYLTRVIYPFLVRLLASLAVMGLVVIGGIVIVLIVVGVAAGPPTWEMLVVWSLLGYAVLIPLMLAATLVILP